MSDADYEAAAFGENPSVLTILYRFCCRFPVDREPAIGHINESGAVPGKNGAVL
jgi:hypothetical protein